MKKDPKDRTTEDDDLFLAWMTGGREHPLTGEPGRTREPAEDPRLQCEDELFEEAMKGGRPTGPARPASKVPGRAPSSVTPPSAAPPSAFGAEDDVFLRAMGDLEPAPLPAKRARSAPDGSAVSVTPRTLIRRVRHGQVAPERTLNLHGMRRDEALRTVVSFVRMSRAEGLRLVLVITGRGLHSKNEPVLRHEVPQWLRVDCSGDVQEVVKAPPELGREGALLVVLRPNRAVDEEDPGALPA